QQGNATSEEIAAAHADLAQAQAQLRKVRSDYAADIANAAAALRAAQARFDALTQPGPDKLSAAQTKVTQAQANLQMVRGGDSAAKTQAELDMRKAVEALVQAQSTYSTARGKWQIVQDTGRDPVNPTKTGPQGKSVPNKLNDVQRQQYHDDFVQAEAAMHSA